MKGKQQPLTHDEQLDDTCMYTVYKDKKEILVRLKVKKSKKRSKSPAATASDEQPAAKKTRYDSQLQRMTEVEDIVDDLQKKTSRTSLFGYLHNYLSAETIMTKYPANSGTRHTNACDFLYLLA